MSDESVETRTSGDTGVKTIIDRYTIYRIKGANKDPNSKVDMGLLPFVGMVPALFMLVILCICTLINNQYWVDTTMVAAATMLAIPIVIYGFNTIQGLMNISDRAFPPKKNSPGPAAVMMPVLIALFVYGLYVFMGLRFMLFYAPALEIAVTLSVVTTLYFSKERKNERYTDIVGSPTFIKAIIISTIAIIVFACLPIIWQVGIEAIDFIRMLLMVILSVLFGFIMAKIVDKRLHGISDSEFNSLFEISRPLIGVVFIAIVLIF